MPNKRRLRLAVTVIAAVFALILATDSLNVAWHNRQLKKAIMAIDTSVPTVSFNVVVPFSWEAVYTFEPYLSKAEMAEIIGFNSRALSETVSEGMTQLVFVRGRAVVASVCGYPDNLGYSVWLDNWDGPAAKVTFAEEAVFSVDAIDGIVSLHQLAKGA